MHGADAFVAGQVLQVRLRETSRVDSRESDWQDHAGHRQGFELPERATQNHPQRRQALQHFDRPEGGDKALRLWHFRTAGMRYYFRN